MDGEEEFDGEVLILGGGARGLHGRHSLHVEMTGVFGSHLHLAFSCDGYTRLVNCYRTVNEAVLSWLLVIAEHPAASYLTSCPLPCGFKYEMSCDGITISFSLALSKR